MPKRDPAHMEAQRERIILATITCIARKGIERTSIADIWKEAGLSAGALYVHFQNKQDLVAQCLQHGAGDAPSQPKTWDELKSQILTFGSRFGLDAATVIRARLHFHAEAVQPGDFHDLHKANLEIAMTSLSGWIQQIADRGEITLRLTARQTAAAISAYLDGMLGLALATDRPIDEALAEIATGMDCFVHLPGTG